MATHLALLRENPSLVHLMVALAVFVTGFVVALVPSFDVIVDALCPGSDACPEALLLSSAKSVVGGVSGMLVAPLMGSFSDARGRKPMLLACLTLLALPIAALAVSRTRTGVYLFFAGGTLAAAVGGDSLGWLSFFLAYVADVIPDDGAPADAVALGGQAGGAEHQNQHRNHQNPVTHGDKQPKLGAFGATLGSAYLGALLGPLLARLIPTQFCFPAALALCAAAVLYLALLLPESRPVGKLVALASEAYRKKHGSETGQAGSSRPADSESHPEDPLTKIQVGSSSPVADSASCGPHALRSCSLAQEAVAPFSSDRALRLLLLVVFLYSFADAGQSASMFYVFKALLHWDKDDYALYITGIGACAMLSQLVLLPLLAPALNHRVHLTVTPMDVAAAFKMA